MVEEIQIEKTVEWMDEHANCVVMVVNHCEYIYNGIRYFFAWDPPNGWLCYKQMSQADWVLEKVREEMG